MRLGKYLLIPWCMLAVYTVLSLHYGTAGLVSYRELLREKQKVLENLDKLQTINMELEGSLDALLYDSETIRIGARELGYGEAGERFVRIVGLPGGRPKELRPGIIRTAVQPLPSGYSNRTVSLCVGLVLLILFCAGDMLAKRERAGETEENP